jgi:hypothetical protein
MQCEVKSGSHGPGLGCFIAPGSSAAWCVVIRDGVLVYWCGVDLCLRLLFLEIFFFFFGLAILFQEKIGFPIGRFG